MSNPLDNFSVPDSHKHLEPICHECIKANGSCLLWEPQVPPVNHHNTIPKTNQLAVACDWVSMSAWRSYLAQIIEHERRMYSL